MSSVDIALILPTNENVIVGIRTFWLKALAHRKSGLLLDGLLLAEFAEFDGELCHKCFLLVNVLEMESFHVAEFASGEFELGPLFHISNQLAFSLDVGGHIFFCFFFREKKMERVCVNVYNLARRCAEMGVQGAGEVDPWLVDEVEVVLGRALDGVCVG